MGLDEQPGTRSVAPDATGASSAGASAAAELAVGFPEERRRSRYRWSICALLFFATTVNYIDRQVMSLLAPTLQSNFGWTEAQYADIVSWWTFFYGAGMLFMGRIMDWIGTKKGFTISVLVWSLAAMSHAFMRTVTGFSIARAALGLGESGNFPGAIKTVAEWFPKKERALATGIFNAGSNVGAVIAPLLVPAIALYMGWQWAFIFTGCLDLIWLGFWLVIYRKPREHAKVTKAELEHIESDQEEPGERVPWLGLLKKRQTWAFIVGKFLTDPIWWFYLFWLPKFLDSEFGVTLSHLALPIIVIYVVADGGSVVGGWFSSALISRGWSVNWGRKTAMLVAALIIVPTMFTAHAKSMWVAVGIVSVAAAAHQWWSANLFTTTSDMFPRRAVASVVGIGGLAGAAGGFLFQRFTGYILQVTNSNYSVIFTMCGLAYVTAWVLIQLIVPRMQPARLEEA
ncbi:MAG TPA: MFS transporter [Longimicrobiaceae bacterium]|nr:MFS transporter [Longimicrobiaceae bacterium]